MILKIKTRYYSYASQMVNKTAILVESETNNYTFSTMFRVAKKKQKKRGTIALRLLVSGSAT